GPLFGFPSYATHPINLRVPGAPGTGFVPRSWITAFSHVVIPTGAARLSLTRRSVARRAAQWRDRGLLDPIRSYDPPSRTLFSWISLLPSSSALLCVLCASALSFSCFSLSPFPNAPAIHPRTKNHTTPSPLLDTPPSLFDLQCGGLFTLSFEEPPFSCLYFYTLTLFHFFTPIRCRCPCPSARAKRCHPDRRARAFCGLVVEGSWHNHSFTD